VDHPVDPLVRIPKDEVVSGTQTAPSASASVVPASRKLPPDRLTRVDAWGMAQSAISYVYRPSTVDGVQAVLDLAREMRLQIGMRGGGCSYGDASLCSEHISLDLSRMNRILDWNPDSGIVRVEPGVTIGQLWQYTIQDGWWPYVVSGTMFPTIGGAASMNIHGKNNFRAGTIGEHIREFEMLLPGGAVRRCSRTENAELFHAAIGGFGMLGCFLSLTLEMKKVHSGLLHVEPLAVSSLGEMFRVFRERVDRADYLVGWIDCFARGKSLGRGLIHQANYLAPGEDPAPTQSLRVENQVLPDMMMGVLPKSMMWLFMKPLVRDVGVRFVNWGKYVSGSRHHPYHDSHAGFAFLLDYVPGWKRAYMPIGLIQFQSFIPADRAEEVFRTEIELARHRGLPPYLGVFKRHRPDPFLMTHALDGYSLALDFRVTHRNRTAVWSLADDLAKIVVEAGGRFYFAKDSTLTHERLESYLAEERVQRFLALKRECDPDDTLQTDLYRRLFLKPGARRDS
jgi:decaprenylphospho-beta-D-ribofuranose 2-oxidase